MASESSKPTSPRYGQDSSRTVSRRRPTVNLAIAFKSTNINKPAACSKLLFSVFCLTLLVCCHIQELFGDVVDANSCFCQGFRWPRCPEQCRRLTQTRLGLHDDFDPDHVDDELSGLEESKYSKAANSDLGTIVRHRKVYLSDKPNKLGKLIHPISITIPVSVEPSELVDLPEPSPLFKMRKYTVQETRPEIEMVPMTTTIIKPANVSQSQIIGDTS